MSELTRFDSYEIAPVREEEGSCEVCAPSEAHFWTLYGHIPGEGVEAISDLKTKADCEDLLYRITGHRNYFLNAEAEKEEKTGDAGHDPATTTAQSLLTDFIARISAVNSDLLAHGISVMRCELEHRPDADHLFAVWHVEDVRNRRPDLTREMCRKVLREMNRHLDAEKGINWNVIDAVANLYYPAPANLDELRENADI